MSAALVIGGAMSLDADLEAIGGLEAWDGMVIGINHAAFAFERLDAVATLHPELVEGWRSARRRAGFPAVPFWTHRRDPGVEALVWQGGEVWCGGASILFAAGLARWRMDCRPVMLIGAGLDDGRDRYGTNHSDYRRYRDNWTRALEKGQLDGIVGGSPGTWLAELLARNEEAVR